MSSRIRHAVSRGFERRLERLRSACATGSDLLTEMLMSTCERLDDSNGIRYGSLASVVVAACLAIDISFPTTCSMCVRCICSLLRIKCPRHKLLSYLPPCASTPRAMSRLLERVRQINAGERCTRHCRMDIACTASHVIGCERQGSL
jgi:hypothetical protein